MFYYINLKMILKTGNGLEGLNPVSLNESLDSYGQN